MALAANHPSAVSKKNKGVLRMSGEQLHEYASTKRKGLPKHHTTVGEMMAKN